MVHPIFTDVPPRQRHRNGKPNGKPRAKVPPLQNGDRLTRAEFERRFDATPNLKKAELIEGIVHMPPPVSQDYHGSPHSHVIGCIVLYEGATAGTQSGDNSTLRLDVVNEPQPDAFLRIRETHGGQSRTDADGYVVGAPELIVEISATSASYDLHEKLDVYLRHGVREYVVWRVLDGEFDYFVLRNDRYVPLRPAARGAFRSRAFPGLWLDAPALVAGNVAKALATLQKGLATKEHAAFVTQLAKTGSASRSRRRPRR